MTLDRSVRLLTGLYFFLIKSRLAFFSNGNTIAVFHWSKKTLSVSEILTILVTAGNTDGSIHFNRSIGIGSASHDFDFMLSITALTSSSIIGVNLCSFDVCLCSGEKGGMSVNPS